jgi:hypothetical protein
MQCKKEQNLENCTCTYPGCSRKGKCCDCIKYHLVNRELPGCCFNEEGEASYDRSFEHFAKLINEKKI